MAVTDVEIRHTPIKQVTFDWTSDAGGDADGTTGDIGGYTGRLVEVRIIPVSADNLYDVVVEDGDGYDLLNGLGANMSDVNTIVLLESVLGSVVSSQLTLVVANGGNVEDGIVIVKVRP
jgi:hypothetical protein